MRRHTRTIFKLGRWAIAPLALAVCQPSGAAEYVLKDLGTLGGTWSEAFDINNNGQVVGWSGKADGKIRAFIYTKPAGSTTYQMVEIPSPPGGSAANTSSGYSLNSAGRVIGYESIPATDISGAQYIVDTPFYYDGVTTIALPISADGAVNRDGVAWDINDSNLVVGQGTIQSTSTDAIKAFSWLPGQTTLTYVGPLDQSAQPGSALGVNATGALAGYYRNASGTSIGFWRNAAGTTAPLGTLGGPNTLAMAINNANTIVGESSTGNGVEYHAFRYKNGVLTDLGSAGQTSTATDINDSETIVGAFATGTIAPANTTVRAFVYTTAQGRRDLNNLIAANSGWVLRTAEGINSAGQITGYGVKDGQNRAFVLDPAGTVDVVRPRPAEVSTPASTPTTMNLSAKNTRGQTLQKVVIQYAYPAGLTVGAITTPSTSPAALVKTVDTTNRLIKLEWRNVVANAVLEADFPLSSNVAGDYTLTKSLVQYTLANGSTVTATGGNALIHVLAGAHNPPTISCTRSPDVNTLTVNQTLTYDCSASNDPQGHTITYHWTVDGVASDTTNPVKPISFATTGSKIVQLMVSDSGGAFANGNNRMLVFQHTYNVVAPTGNQPPSISCTRTPNVNTLNVNQTLTYNCSASTDPENHTITYHWTVDGVASSTTNPVKAISFATTGSKIVQLMVSDSGGVFANGNNQMLAFQHAYTVVAASGTVDNVIASPASVAVAVNVNTKINLSASNNQGQTLTNFKLEYKYPSGISPSNATATFSGGTATVKTKTIDTGNRLVKFEWTGVTAGTALSASFDVKSGTKATYTLTPSKVESTFSNGTKKTGTGNNVAVTVQ